MSIAGSQTVALAHQPGLPITNTHHSKHQLLVGLNEETWLEIGKLAETMNDPERAMLAYESALRQNAYSIPAMNQMATILRASENFGKAIEYFQGILNLDHNNGEIWGSLGHCYLMLDDLQKAYSSYQQALYYLTNPKEPKLWYGIGILYDRFGSLEHAEEAFCQVMRMDPNFDKANEIYFRLGIIYKQQHKYALSLECFNYILHNPPRPLTELDILFQIGHVHEQKKDFPKAREAYNRVLAENPDHAKVLQQLGWLYHQKSQDPEDQQQAVKYLQRSIVCDDADSQSHYLLGRCHMAARNYNKAYEAYQQAVYRDSRNPSFWCSIGVLYYQINQYRDALDAYSRAIRLDGNISEVWYDLGTLYESCNNQVSDAIDAYKRANELDPDNVHIRQRLEFLQNPRSNGTRPTQSGPHPQDVNPNTYQHGGPAQQWNGVQQVHPAQQQHQQQPPAPPQQQQQQLQIQQQQYQQLQQQEQHQRQQQQQQHHQQQQQQQQQQQHQQQQHQQQHLQQQQQQQHHHQQQQQHNLHQQQQQHHQQQQQQHNHHHQQQQQHQQIQQQHQQQHHQQQHQQQQQHAHHQQQQQQTNHQQPQQPQNKHQRVNNSVSQGSGPGPFRASEPQSMRPPHSPERSSNHNGNRNSFPKTEPSASYQAQQPVSTYNSHHTGSGPNQAMHQGSGLTSSPAPGSSLAPMLGRTSPVTEISSLASRDDGNAPREQPPTPAHVPTGQAQNGLENRPRTPSVGATDVDMNSSLKRVRGKDEPGAVPEAKKRELSDPQPRSPTASVAPLDKAGPEAQVPEAEQLKAQPNGSAQTPVPEERTNGRSRDGSTGAAAAESDPARASETKPSGLPAAIAPAHGPEKSERKVDLDENYDDEGED